MASDQISARAAMLAAAIADIPAKDYFEQVLIASCEATLGCACQTEIAEKLSNPYLGLKFVYSHYGFCRRGKDRLELASIATESLSRTCPGGDTGTFLSLSDASGLWSTFEEVCRERRRKASAQLNMGVVAGLAELCQELFHSNMSGSIWSWISDELRATGRLEPQFLRIVDIRGVGPKIASLLVRDACKIFDIEQCVAPIDRLYLHPIDKYLRLIAPYAMDDPKLVEAADWILAGKLAKYSRLAGVSGIDLNMGMTYIGTRAGPGPIGKTLDELLEGTQSHLIADRAPNGFK